MTKDDVKNSLADMHEQLAALEGKARTLQNQNLADVVKSAMGKVHQLSEHPDLERVAENNQTEKLPFDPPPAGPAQQSAFPAPAEGEQTTFHPGDPQFTQRANEDFRDPNNVDLNKDGTLQTAPNTKGVSDVREA